MAVHYTGSNGGQGQAGKGRGRGYSAEQPNSAQLVRMTLAS